MNMMKIKRKSGRLLIAVLLAMIMSTSTLVIMPTISAEEEIDTEVTPPEGEMNTNETTNVPGNSYIWTQTIGNAPGMDQYRWWNQDFSWTHNGFESEGKTIISVTLEIRSWDVDHHSGSYYEHDLIYGDGVYLGELTGASNVWSTTTFSVPANLLSDGTLDVYINIDSTHSYNWWAVTIDWSRLIIVWDYEEPSEFWVEVYNTGSFLKIREYPAPPTEDNVLLTVPDGWILKVLDTHDNEVDEFGHIWWEVENSANEVQGWVANEYLMIGNQEILGGKTEVYDSEERKPIFLGAVNHYYINKDTQSSLYSSKDNDNDFTIFEENNFPVELILAITAQESGDFYFDNEVYGEDTVGDFIGGGVGIMQITGESNRGCGSKLECYCASCREADSTQQHPYPGGWRYKHKYYTNSYQGIFANVKDGFRVLQWAFQDSLSKNDDLILAWIGTVWRYNHGFPKQEIESGDIYLRRVSDRLENLEEYFGEDYQDMFEDVEFLNTITKQYLINKMRNYITGEIKSPAILRVYDSEGRVLGPINGEIKNEILDSDYYEGSFIIVSPSDYYYYEIEGEGEGTYGLTVGYVENGDTVNFTANNIPTSLNIIHQFTIDWIALSQGEEGVTLQIDYNGDGIFEKTIASDDELTQDEFILQTETVIDIDPDTLNLNSTGKWITCYIEFPEGYNVSDINISTILMNNTVLVEAHPTNISDYDNDGISDLMVKFDRQDAQAILESGDNVAITVSGKLLDGTQFGGTDYIKVI